MRQAVCEADLSQPDNSLYRKERGIFRRALWYALGDGLVRSRLLPFSRLKCALLRLFGAAVGEGVYIKPGVRVKFPWHLRVGDYCWIGEDVWIDNLTDVRIGSHVCVSQGAYLCTGNHDWSTPNLRLFLEEIDLQDGCWVGARALVGPGVVAGVCSVLTAGSVLTSDAGPYEIWSGNPAVFRRRRSIRAAKERVKAAAL